MQAVFFFLAVTVGWSFAQSVGSAPEALAGRPCPEIDVSVYKGKKEGLVYRCALLAQLKARGLVLTSSVGQQILSEMLRPYDTVIELSGKAALPKIATVYLFEEFAHTAELTNFYNGSNYQVIYTQPDHSQFFATNNRNMWATVDIIDKTESVSSNNYLLFENGQAKWVFWRFTGKSIFELTLREENDQTRYEAKIHLFTQSGVFHAFFESPLFAYLVRAMFKKIVGDIVDAAHKFNQAETAPAQLDPVFTAQLLRRLKTMH